VSLSERLGNAATRRRRHTRAAAAAIALLAVGAILVFAVDDEPDEVDATEALAAECTSFGERVAREYELSFPEGPVDDAAEAEYLSRAFADTMDELVASLRAIDGDDGDAAAAIDALDARIDEVRADPVPFATNERAIGEGVAEQFDELGLPSCGSEFLDTAS
jgi:cell pole-organizing protein PopZ